jgi:hypothetical protein
MEAHAAFGIQEGSAGRLEKPLRIAGLQETTSSARRNIAETIGHYLPPRDPKRFGSPGQPPSGSG